MKRRLTLLSHYNSLVKLQLKDKHNYNPIQKYFIHYGSRLTKHFLKAALNVWVYNLDIIWDRVK